MGCKSVLNFDFNPVETDINYTPHVDFPRVFTILTFNVMKSSSEKATVVNGICRTLWIPLLCHLSGTRFSLDRESTIISTVIFLIAWQQRSTIFTVVLSPD